MRSWTSPSDRHRKAGTIARLAAGLVVALCALGNVTSLAAPHSGSIFVGAGAEDDAVVTPDYAIEPVRGGGFAQIGGGLDWRLSPHAALFAQGSWQRFFAPGRRHLFAAASGIEARTWLVRSWDLRAAATGSYLDDSARPEARLIGTSSEVAIGHRLTRFEVELRAGWDYRLYPRLELLDDGGQLADHHESRTRAGPGVVWRPRLGLSAAASVTRARTAARESWYDADETSYWGTVRWRCVPRVELQTQGFLRHRRFRARPDAQDRDSTWQLGAVADVQLTPRHSATLGWVATRYNDTLGFGETVHRVVASVTWRFGDAHRARILPFAMANPVREDEGVTLRLRVPDAGTVTVAGDFNGWDPAASPLHRAPGGWWEVRLVLPAGTYQYVFFVDGRPVPLPAGTPSVDDGYGGRNGVLEVRP